MNRSLCDVLDGIRKCYETRNFSYLMGLVEEAQQMAYRMEASLYDKKDLDRARREYKELKAEIGRFKAERDKKKR